LRQRTPLWPYLLVLGFLFVLSLAAPRGWSPAAGTSRTEPDSAQRFTIADDHQANTAEVVCPDRSLGGGDGSFQSDGAPESKFTSTAAELERAADKVADTWEFNGAAELTPRRHAIEAVVADANASKSSDPLAPPSQPHWPPEARSIDSGETSQPPVSLAPVAQPTEPRPGVAQPSGWPAKLVAPLAGQIPQFGQRLGQMLSSNPWTAALEASRSAKAPQPQPTLAANQATTTSIPASRLRPAAAAPEETPLPSVLSSITVPDDPRPSSVVVPGNVGNGAGSKSAASQNTDTHLAAVGSYQRKQEPVCPRPTVGIDLRATDAQRPDQQPTLAQPTEAQPAEVAPPIAVETPLPPPAWPISQCLLAAVDSLSKEDGCGSWAENVHRSLEQLNRLGMDENARAAEVLHDLRRLAAAAAPLAQRVKNLAVATELRRLQYDLLRRLDVWDELAAAARTSTKLELRGNELISLVERYEQDERCADGRRLADVSRKLLDSSDPVEQELGRRLHMHYRNANVRIAVTADLLDRLLPDQQPSNEPVAETILGAPVRGQSTTSARLTVQLLPDPQAWRLNLVAAGTVDSLTSTTHGPVTFVNQGEAKFVVRKLVLVNADGVRVMPATAAADSNTSLNGLYTSYDSIPLVRSLVRNYAMQQRQQQVGQANREAEDKVSGRACDRIDSQLEPRLLDAEKKFRSRFVEPLNSLGLDPTVVTMETSATRLTFRGRLAGAEQLGAFTARPEALADSLASAQIHESALNNLLDNLDLAGKTFTLPDLLEHLNTKLGRADAKLPDDLPEGVHLTFAAEQPLRVRCQDNRLVLELRIAEIRQGKHRWHDFEVRATYRPTSDGLSAALERDGTIELGGQYQGRPEVALRGIFSKVLSRERKVELVPRSVVDDSRLAGLQVTQLLMDDGWIALSIGPKAATARR